MLETITIYGASDDLVEIKGDAPGCDEYDSWNRPLYIELSTGDVFKAEYTDRGVWKITHERHPPSGGVATVLTPVADGDDPDPHTDVLKAVGNVEWVETWRAWPPTDDEIRDKVVEAFDTTRANVRVELSRTDYLSIWGVIQTAKRRK